MVKVLLKSIVQAKAFTVIVRDCDTYHVNQRVHEIQFTPLKTPRGHVAVSSYNQYLISIDQMNSVCVYEKGHL